MRHTRAHTGNRRSHHALKPVALAKCSNCGEAHRPHHMCLSCGFYNGRQVMDMAAEKAKRDARIKAKEERIKNELGMASDTGVAKAEEASAPVEEKAPAAKEKKAKAGKGIVSETKEKPRKIPTEDRSE